MRFTGPDVLYTKSNVRFGTQRPCTSSGRALRADRSGAERKCPVDISQVQILLHRLFYARKLLINKWFPGFFMLTTLFLSSNFSSPDKEKIREIFRYAIEAGIEVQIPDNMLQTRNRLKGGASYDSN